jgi:hypothetical protein
MKKIDKYLENAVENIKNDRAMALTLLTDIMKNINAGHDHKDLGQTASKYLETLQRSNEQLVKVSALLQKTNPEFSGFSGAEKENIYDLLEAEEENVE